MCCERLLAAQAVEGIGPGDPTYHLRLDPTPTSSREARHFVTERAGELPERVGDALALLTSELVTNGVLHARTTLNVGLTLGATRLLVSVADDNAERPEQPPPDNDRPSGRGLLLVAAMAEKWGVIGTDSGKTVWFTLDRAAAMTSGVVT